LAASEADRDLLYFTFKKEALSKAIEEFVEEVQTKGLTVGELYQIYLKHIESFDRDKHQILPFVISHLSK
jgi:hypothetical protein